MEVIADGDRAVIGHDGIYKIMVVKKGKHASFAKHKFSWDACIGSSWGHTWQIQQGNLEKLDIAEACGENVVSKVLGNIQSGADNRNAADLSQKGQNLERERIMEMREEQKGEELIEKIARGNADFESKTRFTQEKFVRHKQKKHGGRIEILKPSMKLIVHQKLATERTKGAYLDVQEFATIMAMANIHANSKVLLADHSSCFMTGAILSKLNGGRGELVSIFQGQLGDSPPHVPLQNYDFPDEVWDKLSYYPAKNLGKAVISKVFLLPELKDEDEEPQPKKQKVEEAEDKGRISRRERQEKRLKKYSRAAELLKEQLECLVIAAKHHPLPWLFMLLSFLKPSCPFVVYCDKKEPLMEIFNKLHESKRAVMLSINSIFERTVQVLPKRTHPEVHMPGNRGYVLYGISVQMDNQVEKQNPLLCFLKLQKIRGNAEVKIRARTPLEYPPDKINMAKKYCFPFDDKTGVQYLPKKETFTFIMTDISGAHIFGYCLLDNSNPDSCIVYCILSSLSWRSSFYDILRFIESQNSNPSVQAQILQILKTSNIPTAECPLEVIPNRIILKPPETMFPDIFGNVSTMVLRSSLTPRLVIEIWVALLFERRVIFKSTSLSTLTDTTSALEELLYPFKWTGIYIMPLPEDLMDYASAPTPYMIGVHSSLYQSLLDKVGSSIVEDGVCVLDLDQQAFYSIEKDRDLELIPKKFMKELEKTFKSWEQFTGNEIQSAFLTLQARLLYYYRQGFQIKDDKIVYSKDLFVAAHNDKSHRSFAEAIIGVQMFEQFSQQRLDEVNTKNTSKRNALDERIASLEDLGLKMPDFKQLGQNSQSMVNKLFDKTMSKTKQIVSETPRRVGSIKGPMSNRTPRVVQAEELVFDFSPTDAAAEQVKPQKPSRPPPPAPVTLTNTNPVPTKPERNNVPMHIPSLIDFDNLHISQNHNSAAQPPVPAPRTQMTTCQTNSSSSNRHDLSEFDPLA